MTPPELPVTKTLGAAPSAALAASSKADEAPAYATEILAHLDRLGRQNEEAAKQRKETTEQVATIAQRQEQSARSLSADIKHLQGDMGAMRGDVGVLASRLETLESEVRAGKASIMPPVLAAAPPASDPFIPVEFSIPPDKPPPMTSALVREIATEQAQKTQSDPDLKIAAAVGILTGTVQQMQAAALTKEQVVTIAKEANTAQTEALKQVVTTAAATPTGKRIVTMGGYVILLLLGLAVGYLQRCGASATLAVPPAASSR